MTAILLDSSGLFGVLFGPRYRVESHDASLVLSVATLALALIFTAGR
jgi:hypothetical protein